MTLIAISRPPVPPPPPPATPRPDTKSFWYSPIPPNRAVHANSAAICADILAQSKVQLPVINGGQNPPVWSSKVTVVPVDQPLIKVQCANTSNHQQEIGATGIPIPPDIYIPPNPPDTDGALLIYQPDAPNDGYVWEIQGDPHWITPGVLLGCNSLSRRSGVNNGTTGHFVSWVGGPGGSNPAALYSTWQANAFGIQGSGLPYPPGLITRDDALRGYVDHAVLLEVVNAGAGQHVWPALFRSDGTAAGGHLGAVVPEGILLGQDPSIVIDPAWPVMDRLTMQAVRDFGAYVTDCTAACVAFRLATDAHDLCDSFHIPHFRWDTLRAYAVGSDPPVGATQPNAFYWHPLAS